MRTAVLIFSFLLGACATFNISEDHFFHPGPAREPAPIEAPGATEEKVTWTSSDGTTIGAAHVTVPRAEVEILYFGGDSFRIDDFGGELARIFTPLGANLFLVDYRGYGRSQGSPTVEALKRDALAAFDYLAARAGDRPIVVHGFSLGSFMAGHVAVSRPVAGLVMEATAPDVAEWAKAQVPAYAKAAVRVNIAPSLLQESNADRVAKYFGPILLLTGSDDTITPPRFANSLHARSASAVKKVYIVRGAKHGNALVFNDAVQEYGKFLQIVRPD